MLHLIGPIVTTFEIFFQVPYNSITVSPNSLHFFSYQNEKTYIKKDRREFAKLVQLLHLLLARFVICNFYTHYSSCNYSPLVFNAWISLRMVKPLNFSFLFEHHMNPFSIRKDRYSITRFKGRTEKILANTFGFSWWENGEHFLYWISVPTFLSF